MNSTDILNTFYRHFAGVVYRLREQYLCIILKNGKGKVVNDVVWSSVGPEYDVNSTK